VHAFDNEQRRVKSAEPKAQICWSAPQTGISPSAPLHSADEMDGDLRALLYLTRRRRPADLFLHGAAHFLYGLEARTPWNEPAQNAANLQQVPALVSTARTTCVTPICTSASCFLRSHPANGSLAHPCSDFARHIVR
jgi:hypothetical protein